MEPPIRDAVLGVVLAAGAGTRFGGPKALARTADGTPWVARAVAALRAGACAEVVVLLGAEASAALPLVPSGARVRVVEDWADGVSATLRAALVEASTTDAAAIVIVPVDTPDLDPGSIERVIAAGRAQRGAALVRSVYEGAPGHPVLIGRAHWAALAASVRGDRGAGPFLTARGALEVECGDLWSGTDIDTR